MSLELHEMIVALRAEAKRLRQAAAKNKDRQLAGVMIEAAAEAEGAASEGEKARDYQDWLRAGCPY